MLAVDLICKYRPPKVPTTKATNRSIKNAGRLSQLGITSVRVQLPS